MGLEREMREGRVMKRVELRGEWYEERLPRAAIGQGQTERLA